MGNFSLDKTMVAITTAQVYCNCLGLGEWHLQRGEVPQLPSILRLHSRRALYVRRET